MLMFFVPIFVLVLLFLVTMPKEKAKQNLPGWQHRAQKELDNLEKMQKFEELAAKDGMTVDYSSGFPVAVPKKD